MDLIVLFHKKVTFYLPLEKSAGFINFSIPVLMKLW